ncbi:unnamed protein product [Paramecium primaurelia]|uniref:Uncharacterized protein n=1 Tax=Paramecium primaurelia TaxID=5886 RepID=A0A8S1JXA7_PARPR|nr:unnamed protein product [Paramecium primaurelia]
MKNIIAATLTTLLIGLGFYQVNLDSASDFERWALKHGKSYYGDEKIYRQTIYYQNKQMIDQHNKRSDVTYLMGENQFMTITNEEFIRLYLSTQSSEQLNDQDKVKRSNIHKSSEKIQKENKRDSVDWRGLVKVKNQGSCPSSYAMSATSVTEGEYAIVQGLSITLSAQQIMDCNYRYDGCNPNFRRNDVWGSLFYVWAYGLYTEQQYPYTGLVQYCQISSKGPWKITSRWGDSEMNILSFKNDLSEHPLSIEVEASKWQFYDSGIFSDCSSATSKANYFALAVGYDSSDNWFVQASFGTTWGESGYIRLAPGNTCGILNEIYYVGLKD